MNGVHIGDGCVIGAGAVVTHDIEPYSIVVGAPAKVLKKRFDANVIRLLEDLQWWDWDDKKIVANIDFLRNPPAADKILKLMNEKES